MEEKNELELAKEILLKRAKEINTKHPDWSLEKCLLEAAKLLEEPKKLDEEPEAKPEPEPEVKPEPEPAKEPEAEPKAEPLADLAKIIEAKFKEFESKFTPYMEALEKKEEKLEMEFVRNDMSTGKPIKVTRQPEELAKITGSKREYHHLGDGGICCWD